MDDQKCYVAKKNPPFGPIQDNTLAFEIFVE